MALLKTMLLITSRQAAIWFYVVFVVLQTTTSLVYSSLDPFDDFESSTLEKCPCQQKSLCLPIQDKKEREVFAFSPVSPKSDNWKYYDWDAVTTIAWNTNKELLCHAHKHGVKIVISKNFDDPTKLCDIQARRQWIQEAYVAIVTNYADGVNIDTEKAMSGQTSACQTLLVKELREELQRHSFTKDSQITFDIAWSPSIDDRYYDWKGLAQWTDFLFVMSYDMRSQIYYHCIAAANSPKALVRQGLNDYLIEYNIDPSKLVLGIPWYGYRYPCKSITADGEFCTINVTSFHGAPCSDATGSQYDYGIISKWIDTNQTINGRQWHEQMESPWFNLKEDGRYYQIWYDDPESLKLKYDMARELNLRGVGMWNVDSLDYSGKEKAVKSTQLMWEAIRSYRNFDLIDNES